VEPKKSFSPREFLKGRRPERFSDTLRTDQPVLDRALLEYHLAKLTSRGQEKDFEHFARHLAQKEICPNLLPQTGPTGGGDSKVDSETYPVADGLSLAWFVGNAREAASERWAFAFSAKEDWRPKVRSDVEKIAKTGRGYKKAFFVTNQYVPDRVRAEVEDGLTKAHGLDVRILDLTWILDKVFENKHEGLAIEDLRLQTSVRTIIRKGPQDVAREHDLEKAEERITKASEETKFGFSFVDDCLLAAELARDLERPRNEVDGRFERAERAAEECGTRHQRLVCAYSQAWTSYWWYEDFPDFACHYRDVESLAEGSQNAYEFELLCNLWNVLFSLVKTRVLDDAEVALDERTRALTTGLDRLIGEEGRPSTSLQARSLKLLVQLLLSGRNSTDTSVTFAELGIVIRESRGLVGFPLEPLVDVLMELGKVLGELTGYQELIETIAEVSSERSGEVRAARVLTTRGMQQLNADRPADAIRTIGRALARLYKHESRHDLVRALYVCGVGYERVGLLWAARGSLLNAASIATNDFWSYEEVTRQQAACYNHLKWLELRLARLPQTLAWHELDRAVRSVLASEEGSSSEEYIQSELTFDGILGMMFLRADLWDLKRLTKLPDVLEGMGLFNSSIALRYALGDEASVEEDLRECSVQPLAEYFRMWRDQPACEQTPGAPELYDRRSVTLSSRVLGCTIIIETENDAACIILAESILSATESLMATGIVDRVMAHEPKMSVSIRKSDFGEKPFSTSFTEVSGRPHIDVRCCNFDWASKNGEAQKILRDKVFELIAGVLARVFLFRDMEETLTRLFRDDRALERAVDFTMGFAATGNILGHAPRLSVSNWASDEAREYPLTRSERWDARLPAPAAATTPEQTTSEIAASESPRERFHTGQLDHSQMQTVSLIRIPLWNQANWKGTAFIWTPDNLDTPLIAPVFENAAAAGEIFRLWHEELGSRDEKERLRITILRGVKRSEPFTYRVIFGLNPDVELRGSRKGLAVMVARVHTMEPNSHENLYWFLENFHAVGQYGLAHCILEPHDHLPEVKTQYIINKRDLFVRDAWQIGPNDVDLVGLHEDDDPIIPEDQANAPVLEVLRRKRGS
jgi:hypothetical protein